MIRRVLIVDDSSTSRLIIQRCCQIAGWHDAEFLHASNGREALDIVHNRPVDLILSDFNMPEIDGLKLAESLNEGEFIPGVPMVVITSGKNEVMTEKLKALGVIEVLEKPINPAEINRILQLAD